MGLVCVLQGIVEAGWSVMGANLYLLLHIFEKNEHSYLLEIRST